MTDNNSENPKSKWGSIALLVGALLVGVWLFYSGPVTEPEDPIRPARIVKTTRVQPITQLITVRAYGTVIPSRQVTLEPEVTGPIIRHHPALIPGGTVRTGEELFTIDPRLSQLSLDESRAMVDRVQATLSEAERKRDETARLVNQSILSPTELATLESDVKIQDAELKQLTAAMQRTEELLRRHRVLAPFNALVLAESVEVGQRVDPGFAAATLVGTDTFWVQASLPVDQLHWIKQPDNDTPGTDADVYLETGSGSPKHWRGKVIRLLGDIQPAGRMARLLVSIPNPLETDGTSQHYPLLLGSYVRVEIDAGRIENVYSINRTALRDGNRVWIVDSNDELEIRDVSVRWTRDEFVYIDQGLSPGERIVVSPLRVALPGMKVTSQDDVTDDSVTMLPP